MKKLHYILASLALVLLASCMGADYADPELSEAPFGNNSLEETNVVTIAQLKAKYANVISSSSMTEVTEDIQIKGFITGNDVQGNIYNEVALQDATGAILVCIAQGGLYGSLPVGQQVLISLKGLMIGGYGQQPEIGGVYTNSKTGAQSIGRMSRFVWNEHYKLVNDAAYTITPEVFDVTRVGDADYLAANCGKLMTLKNVQLKDANGTKVYAPDDGSVSLTANCANRAFKGISSSKLVLRTSTYADFANAVMPEEAIDVTGIFTRYRNVWQILLRTADDVQTAVVDKAIYEEPFDDDQGDFTIIDVTRPDDLNYVWKWASAAYGMKASAYVGGTYYVTDSWLVSPAIDLSSVKSATLTFEQTQKYGSDNDRHVMISTTYSGNGKIDASQWQELTLDQWPDGTSWNFITSTVDLSSYCGKQVYIAFRYTSSESVAATWEVKNFKVE